MADHYVSLNKSNKCSCTLQPQIFHLKFSCPVCFAHNIFLAIFEKLCLFKDNFSLSGPDTFPCSSDIFFLKKYMLIK